MVKVSFDIYLLFRLFSFVSLIIFFLTVVPDGYGLSYSIGDDHIRWTITSMKWHTDELKNQLSLAALQVMTVLRDTVDIQDTKL